MDLLEVLERRLTGSSCFRHNKSVAVMLAACHSGYTFLAHFDTLKKRKKFNERD